VGNVRSGRWLRPGISGDVEEAAVRAAAQPETFQAFAVLSGIQLAAAGLSSFPAAFRFRSLGFLAVHQVAWI
jgi:hypothetical protein